MCFYAGSLTEHESPSLWDQLMQKQNVETGTCSSRGCYVDLGTEKELQLLHVGEDYIDENNPCFVYQCTVCQLWQTPFSMIV